MRTWDEVAETTAVTSNPAAGVISVDVKTFTGRGRVTSVYGYCVADATVANRTMVLQKVSGAVTVTLGQGAAFVASATGLYLGYRGIGVSTIGLAANCIPECDFAPGDILRVVVSGGQAGDDMSAITYSYKEML